MTGCYNYKLLWKYYYQCCCYLCLVLLLMLLTLLVQAFNVTVLMQITSGLTVERTTWCKTDWWLKKEHLLGHTSGLHSCRCCAFILQKSTGGFSKQAPQDLACERGLDAVTYFFLPCAGILWHPWERWACSGWWSLGRRGQGEGKLPKAILTILYPSMVHGDAFPKCPIPWIHKLLLYPVANPKPPAHKVLLLGRFSECSCQHLSQPHPMLLIRNEAFFTEFLTNSLLFVIITPF